MELEHFGKDFLGGGEIGGGGFDALEEALGVREAKTDLRAGGEGDGGFFLGVPATCGLFDDCRRRSWRKRRLFR
jgi:hypothetical protein